VRTDAAAWRSHDIDVIVSMLSHEEVLALGLQDEEQACKASGIKFINLPVIDHGIPISHDAWSTAVTELAASLHGGASIAAHCFAGLGRSPTLAACVLVGAGMSADEAILRLSHARGTNVPETVGQRSWIYAFERLTRARR